MGEVITEKDYPIRVRWIFKGAILSTAALLTFFILFFWPLWFSQSDYSIVVILTLLLLILSTVAGALLQRQTFHFSLEEKLLKIRQGIIAKQERYIPYAVIQNTYVKQDVLDRLLKLVSLQIENASQGTFGLTPGAIGKNEQVGSLGNSVRIPGLSKKDAEKLKELILQKIKENPRGDTTAGL